MSEISAKLLTGPKIRSIGWDEMIETNDAIRIVLLHEQDLSIRHIVREMPVRCISRHSVVKICTPGWRE